MSRTLLMCKKHSFHSVNYFMSLGFQVHLEGILVKVWKYLSAWGFSFKSVLSVNSWREERSKSQTRWWEEVLPDETRGLEARSEIDLCTLRSWVLTGQIKIKFEARDGGCKHGNRKFKGSLSYMVSLCLKETTNEIQWEVWEEEKVQPGLPNTQVQKDAATNEAFPGQCAWQPQPGWWSTPNTMKIESRG